MIARTLRAFVRAVTGGTNAPGRAAARAGDGFNRDGFNRKLSDSEMGQVTGGYEGPGDYNVDEWLHNANRRTAVRIVKALRGQNRVNS